MSYSKSNLSFELKAYIEKNEVNFLSFIILDRIYIN